MKINLDFDNSFLVAEEFDAFRTPPIARTLTISVDNFKSHPLFKVWNYSGGELGFQLDANKIDTCGISRILINCRLHNTEDIMLLRQLVSALKLICSHIVVFVPYMPYSRQDRDQCDDGIYIPRMSEFVQSILPENCKFVTLDVHSHSTRITNISVEPIIKSLLNSKTLICFPDGGAISRYENLARYSEKHIFGEKKRSPTDGKITGYELKQKNVKDYRDFDEILVIDDICDGGATFKLLADSILQQIPGKILKLYVTHGIFSKGLDNLKRYADIYSTKAFSLTLPEGVKKVNFP